MADAKTTSRSAFMTAADCTARFVEQRDKYKTYVDLWKVTIAGKTFLIEMMKRHNVKSSWVFGSIFSQEGNIVWTFPTDPRVKKGFKGNVSTKAFPGSDITWVFFESWKEVVYVLPLSELLAVSGSDTINVTHPKSLSQTTPVKGNEMEWFVENVLAHMGS